jgi:hypothetical protein
MHPKVTLSIGLMMLGLLMVLARGTRALADDVEATLQDQKSEIDKQNKLHLEATATINAPENEVYDALIHPEKIAKYDARVDSVKVISRSASSKVLEFRGRLLPIPKAPPALDVKYTFDANTKQVTAESYGKSPIRFRNDYSLKPGKDGKETQIAYTSVSTSGGPVMGIEPPKFMRTQFAIESFMRNLHYVSIYIMKNGK